MTPQHSECLNDIKYQRAAAVINNEGLAVLFNPGLSLSKTSCVANPQQHGNLSLSPQVLITLMNLISEHSVFLAALL